MNRRLTVVDNPQAYSQLQNELNAAQQALQAAEAELASTQAAINAFRMHCRLKLDDVVEKYLTCRTEKQTLLTRLQLWRQAAELGIDYDEDDPFWRGDVELENEENDPLLPTETLRDKAAEKRLYRELARKFHPDLGMTSMEMAYRTEMMSAVNNAYAQNDIQALYDLAGELDPTEMAQLSAIEDLRMRRVRQKIMRVKQLRRKSIQKLQILRQENTARLWQMAQELEDAGKDWWTPVRQDIEEAIEKRMAEIAILRSELEKFEPAEEISL